MKDRWLLVYDPACGLCVKLKNLAGRLDLRGRLEEAGLDDPRIRLRAPGFDPLKIPKDFHLILPDGRVRTGEAALPEFLALFPGGRPLAWCLARMPGSRRLLRAFLRRLAGSRD